MRYPDRSSLLGVAFLACAVGLGVLVLASGGSGEPSGPAGSDTAASRAATVAPGRAGREPSRPDTDYDLASLLLSGVDPPFTPADRTRYPQGSLDVAAAARRESDPAAEREVLESRGFQRGHERTWSSPDGDVITAVLYQFGDQAGAASYLAHGVAMVVDQDAVEFAVPFAAAHGFTQTDGSATVHSIALVREAYFFLVALASDRAAMTPEHAKVIAAAQLARLPGRS